MKYDGKIVRTRGHIWVAFEDFTLNTEHCQTSKDDSKESIWLEYGSGPGKHPTIWCCGNIDPTRGEIPVLQDESFDRFKQFVSATHEKQRCYDCYRFDVTATLTGRLDYATNQNTNPQGQTILLDGFGHLGMAKFRLVIQSVSDVEVKDYGNGCAPRRCHCNGYEVSWVPERKAEVRVAGRHIKDAEIYSSEQRPGMILVAFDLMTIILDIPGREAYELGRFSYYLDVSRGERNKRLVWDTGEDVDASGNSCGPGNTSRGQETAGCRWARKAKLESAHWTVRDSVGTREVRLQLGFSARFLELRIFHSGQ